MKYDDIRKNNNDDGYSLVELIVVIAILAIMTGVVSLGISLMFSRDAESVAKTIDDELSEARMLAMSREGKFEMIIHIDKSNPSANTVVIKKDGAEYKTVSMKKNASIKISGGGISSAKDNGDVKIEFDKGNGSAKIEGEITSEVCLIEATATRLSSKKSTVTLVPTTGRHYIGK